MTRRDTPLESRENFVKGSNGNRTTEEWSRQENLNRRDAGEGHARTSQQQLSLRGRAGSRGRQLRNSFPLFLWCFEKFEPCTSVIYTKISNFIFKKLKRELPQDLTIPLLDIYPRDSKQGLKETPARACSQQPSSQDPKDGSNTSVRPQVNG